MTVSSSVDLKNEVAKRERLVKRYLLEEQPMDIDHPHLRDAVYSYIKAGGKSLRPAVLMFCCGLVGGDENTLISISGIIDPKDISKITKAVDIDLGDININKNKKENQ